MDPPTITVDPVDEEESKEIHIDFPPPHLPARLNIAISNNKSEEDDDSIEKSFSPSKYFGKRPSFEYRNLKKIERTTHRANSAIPKNRETPKEGSPINNSNKPNEETSSQDNDSQMDNSKVHFSEKVIEARPDDVEDSSVVSNIVEKGTNEQKPLKEAAFKPKKPKKSILKKTHFNEEVTLERIFRKELNQAFIEKINLESAKEGKHFSEKIAKCFTEHWKALVQEKDAIVFLQGVFPESLQYIFKDGIEFSVLFGMIQVLKNAFESNMTLTYEFLRNFPTIKKFDIVASCFLPKEKEEINGIVELLVTNGVIDEKKKNELKKVYVL